jgi:hypothetical protein
MYWSLDTAGGFTQVNMSNIGDTFRANIPAQPLNTKVYYYIWANSISSRTSTKPITAPRGNIQFLVTNTAGITNLNNGVPEKFTLYQNYPNPFNPTTKIKFDIPKSSFVELKIYDISGREVSILVSQKLEAGTYKFDWNVPSSLSAGLLYKLLAGNYTNVRKLIFIK